MDQTTPDRPVPAAGGQGDPSVQHRGRAFVRSTVVTWIAVIILALVFIAVIAGFAAR